MSVEAIHLTSETVEQLGGDVAERMFAEEQAILRTISLAGSIAVAAEQTDELLFEWGRYDQKARGRTYADKILETLMQQQLARGVSLNHARRMAEEGLVIPRPVWSLGRSRPFPGLVAATTSVNKGVCVTEGFAVNRKPRLGPAGDYIEQTARLSIDAVTLTGDVGQRPVSTAQSIYSIRALRQKRDKSPVLELKDPDKKEVTEDEAYFVLDILYKAQEKLKMNMPKLKRRKK